MPSRTSPIGPLPPPLHYICEQVHSTCSRCGATGTTSQLYSAHPDPSRPNTSHVRLRALTTPLSALYDLPLHLRDLEVTTSFCTHCIASAPRIALPANHRKLHHYNPQRDPLTPKSGPAFANIEDFAT